MKLLAIVGMIAICGVAFADNTVRKPAASGRSPGHHCAKWPTGSHGPVDFCAPPSRSEWDSDGCHFCEVEPSCVPTGTLECVPGFSEHADQRGCYHCIKD